MSLRCRSLQKQTFDASADFDCLLAEKYMLYFRNVGDGESGNRDPSSESHAPRILVDQPSLNVRLGATAGASTSSAIGVETPDN